MDTCARCGAELGVGRFCLNCGHLIGSPVPPGDEIAVMLETAPERAPDPVVEATPTPAPAPVIEEAPVTAATPAFPAYSSPQAPPRQWDPREDLLPYDDVRDEPVLTGRAWVGWVIGAALLVGLVFVLLNVFAVDGEVEPDATASDEETSQESEPTEEPSEEPPAETEEPAEGVGKPVNAARNATFAVPSTAPPTTDFDGQLVDYEAAQMHDGIPSTTWRMAGDGTGAVITITLPQPTVVTRLGLINGYAKQVSGVDWYPNNRRILAVQWGFDNGSTLEQTFAERPGMQLIKVPAGVTGTVTLTITSVTPPGPGSLGRDYTAISEVVITGRRAA